LLSLTDAISTFDKGIYANVQCKVTSVVVKGLEGCAQCLKTLAMNEDTQQYHCVRKSSIRAGKCKPPILKTQTAWCTVSSCIFCVLT